MTTTLTDDDRAALVALSRLPKVGPGRLRALLEGSTPMAVWQRICGGVELTPRLRRSFTAKDDVAAVLDEWTATARCADPAADLARHRAAGIVVVAPGDAAWPFALDPDPPAVLYALGALALLGDIRRVAIVGTRQCTADGSLTANELGLTLARNGISVVSGLAAGIDGAAHVGALGGGTVGGGDLGGSNLAPPIGVVATGLDVVYPRDHRRLWRSVAATGLLVSEVPLGTRPTRWRFPARNRIIAALSDVVVVVESPAAGGSMHTVDEALRRSVPVLAVPGPVRSRASQGTNRLLADGAAPLCDAGDVFVALGEELPVADPGAHVPSPAGAAGRLLDAMGWRPATLDQLVGWTGLPLAEAALAVDELERSGWVATDGGWLERKR